MEEEKKSRVENRKRKAFRDKTEKKKKKRKTKAVFFFNSYLRNILTLFNQYFGEEKKDFSGS